MSDDAERAARLEYDLALARLENAYQGGDDDERTAASEVHRAAGEKWARALAAKVASTSFEQILADPTSQMDPNGEILASIIAYQNAKPASASAPIRRGSS